jgi:transcriptional regulator with XRE-family HTH domain
MDSECQILTKQISKIPKLLTQKELRDERRYKQKDIADGTGLSEGMISRLLRHKDISNLNYESAKAIANWLGVAMEELGENAEE